MKKIKFYLLVFLILSCISINAQTRKQKKMAGYLIENYEVECMGTGMDGTQVIKIWGYGKNVDKAVYQAKKNAVHAIIFKGIQAGRPGCMRRPLVTEPGAEIKYRDFFETFFKDGGHYLKFITLTGDGQVTDRIRVSKKYYKAAIIVSIAHSDLRKELENAGIIRKLGDGF